MTLLGIENETIASVQSHTHKTSVQKVDGNFWLSFRDSSILRAGQRLCSEKVVVDALKNKDDKHRVASAMQSEACYVKNRLRI